MQEKYSGSQDDDSMFGGTNPLEDLEKEMKDNEGEIDDDQSALEQMEDPDFEMPENEE